MSAETLPKVPVHNAPQQQITLPFSRAWQISMKSIKIRFARSLITAGGILLGIAFFSSVRSGMLFAAPPVGSDVDAIAEAAAAAHRQSWLAIMALLVCFVGIMNSMLMSVTERFKEIGTMKCLGALDKFIVTLFFIEAGLMGVIASALGWFLGWVIIVLLHLFSGGLAVLNGPFWVGSLMQFLESLGIGLSITLIAAIPPAVNAAKMPPAAALRSTI
jgi:putative ABC transport system permease protein